VSAIKPPFLGHRQNCLHLICSELFKQADAVGVASPREHGTVIHLQGRYIIAIKRKLAVVAIVAATFGATMLLASPASAATSNCPSGATCIWKDSGYASSGNGGSEVGFQNSVDWYTFYSYPTVGGNADDSASSVYNNGNVSTSYMYVDPSFKGPSFRLSIKTGDGDLSNNVGYAPPGFNDLISSGRFV
jgi:hypothetical protein